MRDFPEDDHLAVLLGRFLVAFEGACSIGRYALFRVLYCSGLKDQSLGTALVADMAAWQVHRALLAQSGIVAGAAGNQHLREYAAFTLKAFQKLIEERNDIVHSVWAVDYERIDTAGHLSPVGFIRSQWQASKRGVRAAEFTMSSQNLEAKVTNAHEVADYLRELATYLQFQADEDLTRSPSVSGGETAREYFAKRLQKEGERFVIVLQAPRAKPK